MSFVIEFLGIMLRLTAPMRYVFFGGLANDLMEEHEAKLRLTVLECDGCGYVSDPLTVEQLNAKGASLRCDQCGARVTKFKAFNPSHFLENLARDPVLAKEGVTTIEEGIRVYRAYRADEWRKARAK